MVKVSVVIPNYNGEKYLRECLEALVKQEEVEFETIIIDNASQDSNYLWVERYDNIIFKRLDQNYGFSKAVNEGIKKASGKYILLLNNDTVVQKSFIKELVKDIEKDDRIFSVSSKMIAHQNHQLMDDAGDEYNVLGWAYKLGDGKPIGQYVKPYKIFSACGGAALYRKAIFDEIGLFDEHFFAYMEDVDIGYRARIHGYYNVYCPEAKVYHIGSATSGSKYNGFKVKLAARNNIFVSYKNMPIIQLMINLPALILGMVIKYIWFVQKGFGKEYFAGLKEGILQVQKVHKVKFKFRQLRNYIVIEGLLIKNLFKYIGIKLNLIFYK